MTVSASPVSPFVGDTVTLSLSGWTNIPSDPLAYSFQVTQVPTGSAVSLGALVDGAGNSVATFVADRAGAYVVTGYRYKQFYGAPGFGGESTAGYRILESVENSTINVYERLDFPLRASNGHGATLRLAVSNSRIATATLVNPLTDISRQMTLDASVGATVSALVGLVASTIGPAFVTSANELKTNYAAHRVLVGGVHTAPDTVDAVVRDNASDVTGALAVLNDIRAKLLNHLIGASAAGARWHTTDDNKNLPLSVAASDLQSGLVLLCDLRQRVYERHRVQVAAPASHGAVDTTNVLGTAITVLESLVVAVFDYLASAVPTPPTGEPAAALSLQALYGFKVSS